MFGAFALDSMPFDGFIRIVIPVQSADFPESSEILFPEGMVGSKEEFVKSNIEEEKAKHDIKTKMITADIYSNKARM